MNKIYSQDVIPLPRFPSCAGIGRNSDRLNKERLERLKKEAEIDHSETCYAGKGRLGSAHLSPVPEDSERRSKQNYL